MSIERPAIYVVATPIGNLGDLSARAIEILSDVDYVLAEDTRVSRRLFDFYAITTAMKPLHDHNERRKATAYVDELIAKQHAVAVISDAGTPLISDPGYRLIDEAHRHGIPVRAVPGPSAVIAAMSVAGLPTDRFSFEGFLPARAGVRRRVLTALANATQTLVFYEAPHRLIETLEDMAETLGAAREVALVRELTKIYEIVIRGPVTEILQRVIADPNQTRGEIVLVVAGAAELGDDLELAKRLLESLLKRVSRKDAAEIVTEVTGVKRNEIYRLSLRLSKSDPA